MRMFLAILMCKLAYFFGHLIGRGSSLPGEIALKIYPDILSRIKLPEYVIAVTGSNGKTSTVEMITHILGSQGKNVVTNREGSNLDAGIAAVMLYNSTFRGVMKADAVVLESDERFSKRTFGYFSPTHYAVLNLYRDQLTRNAHPEWVYEYIKESIPDNCTLILNADDPLISLLGRNRKNVVWFGMDRQSFSTAENTSVYDDGAFCPNCKSRMNYNYRHFNHIGDFYCDNCGHKKHKTDFTVSEGSADLKNGIIAINGGKLIKLGFKSVYNVCNILGCFAVCSLAGIDEDAIAKEISDYVLKNGRVIEFYLGASNGTFLVSKHENSVSYDQSIRYIVERDIPCGVIIIVDAVSRRYSTGEISWLYDIDFELLNALCVEHIYLLGSHATDLETRFSYTDILPEKISVMPDIDAAVPQIAAKKHDELYTITCFSDKAKFLSNVKIK